MLMYKKVTILQINSKIYKGKYKIMTFILKYVNSIDLVTLVVISYQINFWKKSSASTFRLSKYRDELNAIQWEYVLY